MSSMFGLGGSAADTDRKVQLDSWNSLKTLFDFGHKHGSADIKSAESGLGKASDYFGTLMSGNRPAMSKVLAPQISTIQNQATQQRNTQSQFGNRSGGTNAAMQMATDEATKSIQGLFDMLGPSSAEEFAKISGMQGNLGLGLEGEALDAQRVRSDDTTQSRQMTLPIEQAQQKAWMQLATSMLFGSGGGAPTTG